MVILFFKKDTSDADVKKFVEQLGKVKGVTEIRFVSKEEAINIYKEKDKNNRELLSSFIPDVLLGSTEVSIDSDDAQESVINFAKEKNFVEEIIKDSKNR